MILLVCSCHPEIMLHLHSTYLPSMVIPAQLHIVLLMGQVGEPFT